MRFQQMFFRQIGGSAKPAGATVVPPLVGSDVAPTTAPPNAGSSDNLIVSRFQNSFGWPCHRLVIGYACTAAGGPLNADLYIWDELSLNWFRVNGATPLVLTVGNLTFADIVSLLEPPQTGSNNYQSNAGSIEAMLVITSSPVTAGLYTVVMAPDLTTFSK